MSFQRNRRLRRPAIEPIQTGNANLLEMPRRSLRRRSSALTRLMSTEGIPLNTSVSGLSSPKEAAAQLSKRQELQQLRIPSCTPDATGLKTPFGTMWTVSGQLHSTPVSAISPCTTQVLPFVVEASSIPGHNWPIDRSSSIFVPSSPNPLRMSIAISLSTSRRPSESGLRPPTHLEQLRQSRLALWEQGPRTFGCMDEADVFVKPMQLRGSSRDIRSWSEGPGTASSALSPSKRLFVRAIIHSKSHMPIGLKREFDLDALRATIPEALPSPRSPNFNRAALLSKLDQSSGKPAATVCAGESDHEDDEVDGSDGSDVYIKVEEPSASPPIQWRKPPSGCVAVPIHTQYARSQLPALAAIIMSDRVKRGDTIELALPHPKVWPETVAYVYTGEEELLSERVQENILYLGGKLYKPTYARRFSTDMC